MTTVLVHQLYPPNPHKSFSPNSTRQATDATAEVVRQTSYFISLLSAKFVARMSTRKSGLSVSSVPGSDRVLRSGSKKGGQPHPSIGAIFRPAATQGAAIGTPQSTVQDGEQPVSSRSVDFQQRIPTGSQDMVASGSTTNLEGVQSFTGHRGPNPSHIEQSAGGQSATVARGAQGQVESMIPNSGSVYSQPLGVASSARPLLATSSPTVFYEPRQLQSVPAQAVVKRQVSPQLPIGVITSSDSSPSSGEQAQMLRQAYGVQSTTYSSGQQKQNDLVTRSPAIMNP